MATKAKRPRIKNYVQYVKEDTAIYATDPINTRKPKVTAEVMVALRENARQPSFQPSCNDLFHTRKVWRMLIKALNKGKLFHYRNLNISNELHLDTTPRNKAVNTDLLFFKKQRESAKSYGKRVKRNTQATAQVLDLQVA